MYGEVHSHNIVSFAMAPEVQPLELQSSECEACSSHTQTKHQIRFWNGPVHTPNFLMALLHEEFKNWFQVCPFDPTSIRLVVHAGISPLQICLDGLLGLLLDSLSVLSSKLAQRLSKPAGRIVLESPVRMGSGL